jgi:hypothetical protein
VLVIVNLFGNFRPVCNYSFGPCRILQQGYRSGFAEL